MTSACNGSGSPERVSGSAEASVHHVEPMAGHLSLPSLHHSSQGGDGAALQQVGGYRAALQQVEGDRAALQQVGGDGATLHSTAVRRR